MSGDAESLRDVPEPPTEWRKLNQNVPLWECPVCRAASVSGDGNQ